MTIMNWTKRLGWVHFYTVCHNQIEQDEIVPTFTTSSVKP